MKSASEEGSNEKLELKSYLKNRAEGKVDAELESKWGFLKNIINIDVFFAGPGSGKSESSKSDSKVDDIEDKAVDKALDDASTSRDTRPGEKIKPKSSWKPVKKPANGDLEDALEDGKAVTDSDGNIWKKTNKKDKEVSKLKKKYDD